MLSGNAKSRIIKQCSASAIPFSLSLVSRGSIYSNFFKRKNSKCFHFLIPTSWTKFFSFPTFFQGLLRSSTETSPPTFQQLHYTRVLPQLFFSFLLLHPYGSYYYYFFFCLFNGACLFLCYYHIIYVFTVCRCVSIKRMGYR